MNISDLILDLPDTIKGVVYLAVNKTNNKMYFGMTTTTLNARKRCHKCYSKISKNRFSLAIKKYGIEGFYWYIIFNSLIKSELLEKERYFITLFNTIENGYNLTCGGEHPVFSQETKDKISRANKGKLVGDKNPMFGKRHPQELLDRLNADKRGKSYNVGFKHTEETKENMRKARKISTQNPVVLFNMSRAQKSKPFKCIETGEVFYSAGELANKIRVLKGSVKNHLKRRVLTLKGLTYQYILPIEFSTQ